MSMVNSSPESGINDPDGNIFTGYHSNRHQIIEHNCENVGSAQKAKSIDKYRGKKTKRLQNIIAKVKRKIVFLKKLNKEQLSKLEESKGEEKDTDDEAGNKFGGKKSKKISFKVKTYATSKRRNISQIDMKKCKNRANRLVSIGVLTVKTILNG